MASFSLSCLPLLHLLNLLQLQLCAVVLLIISCSSWSTLQYAGAAHRHRPQQMVLQVRGFVFCDACQESRLSNFSLPIPGALILLTCESTRRHPSRSTPLTRETSSDKDGAFSFDTPFSNPRSLRKCKVELTHSPFKACTTQTHFSKRVFSPIFRVPSKGSAHIAYSTGWLSYQPKTLPQFCSATSTKGFTHSGHGLGRSKDTMLQPEDFFFPYFFPPLPGTPTPTFPFPPLPGTPTPTFPFNFFPPLPPIPGLTPPTFPFNVPPFPGFPPFPQFPPFANFPGLPPFPTVSSPPPQIPNPFANFPPFPPLGIPPNPFSPGIPNNPFTNPTPQPTMNVPPLPLPPLPPSLSFPPFSPNPSFPSTPTAPLNSPPIPLPPFQFPTVPPSLQFPPFSPIPMPPSNPIIP